MIIMVCSECGSSEVLKDAYARWDYETQKWVLDNVSEVGMDMCKICLEQCEIEQLTVQ